MSELRVYHPGTIRILSCVCESCGHENKMKDAFCLQIDLIEKERDKLKAENARLREALEKIAKFGHAESCNSRFVPVYECCCYELSQWEIAEEALRGEG